MEFKNKESKTASTENITRPRDAFFQGVQNIIQKFEEQELYEDAAIISTIKDRYNQYLKGLLKEKSDIQTEEKYSTYSIDEFLGLVPYEGEKNYRSTRSKEVPVTAQWGEMGGVLFDALSGKCAGGTSGDIQEAIKEEEKTRLKFYKNSETPQPIYEPISSRFSSKAEEIFLKTLQAIPPEISIDQIHEYINKKIRDDQMRDIGQTRVYYPITVNKEDYRIILQTNIPGVTLRLFHTESEGVRHEIYFVFKENFLKQELSAITNKF